MKLTDSEIDKIISSHVDSTVTKENLQSTLTLIQEAANENGLNFSQNEGQFIADVTQIISKFVVKNAVVATINTINDLNGR